MESIEGTVFLHDLALAGAGQLAQPASHCSLSVYQSIQSVRQSVRPSVRTPSVKNVITLTLFYFGSQSVKRAGPERDQDGTRVTDLLTTLC